MEKHKYIVDHQIKEFCNQIEPKQQDIANMREYMRNLGQELEGYHVKNTELQKNIMKMTEDIEKIKILNNQEKQEISSNSKIITSICRDIEAGIRYFQDDFETFSVRFSLFRFT